TVSDLSGVELPTVPPKVVLALIVSPTAPLTVLPAPTNETVVALSVVGSRPSVTAPVYCCAPLVVTSLPLIAVVPLMVNDFSGVGLPTVPPKVVLALTVRPTAPFSVLPAPTNETVVALSVVGSRPSVTAPVYCCAPLVVTRLPLMAVVPLMVSDFSGVELPTV